MEKDSLIKAYREELMESVPERWWNIVARGGIKSLVVRLKIHQEAESIDNLKEAIATGQPVFLFSNHVSWADHFLIMNMIDDHLQVPVSALCKEKYYAYPFFGWALRRTNQIPITNVKLCYARWFRQEKRSLPRESDFVEFMNTQSGNPFHEVNVAKRQSLVRTAAYTINMIERNRLILGYPEGTRSLRGSLQAIKTGIMQLPFECKGIVVPAAISGTDSILPRGVKWYNIFKFYQTAGGNIKVRFGPGIDYLELLNTCQEKFECIEDPVNLGNVELLRELIRKNEFRAYTLEAERFERIFDESSLIIMRAVNDILPEKYRTEQVEIKYPRKL